MEFSFTQQEILMALGIFMLRVVNQSLDTLRVVMMLRGRRLSTWILGFVETAIFVVALSSVISGLDNILNIIGYSAGFATGNTLGMWVEDRLAIGFINLRIVSPKRGTAMVQRLREAGFGVTEIPARGKDGTVSLLNLSVRRKEVDEVQAIVEAVDGTAFITSEETRPLRRGFWG
ncbi:MAG: DUF2179 domain-containing protein [Anaerolineales bacterium]|jgi:uncharacterized protein YebE (UPF0316 family)|nr:DUF2179 domain-containing protein [Anaerolineales bacterium]MCW5839175.1 DUF2179 domain-containing protein [Anaerolineales bacterium]